VRSRLRETHTSIRETVHGRRLDVTSVRTHMVGSQGVDGDEQNVGRGRLDGDIPWTITASRQSQRRGKSQRNGNGPSLHIREV
jgi:hypothetical protein